MSRIATALVVLCLVGVAVLGAAQLLAADTKNLAVDAGIRETAQGRELQLGIGTQGARPADAAKGAESDSAATDSDAAGGDDDEPRDWNVQVGDGKVKVKSSRRDDRVIVGSDLEVRADETVHDAVVIGGTSTIAGHVKGDAVAVGGRVNVLDGAEIDGDCVAVGGTCEVAPGATVGGDRVSLGGTLGSLAGGFTNGVKDWAFPWALFHTIAVIVRTLIVMLFATLILAIAPEHVKRMQGYLEARPVVSGAAGLSMLIALAPLCLLLVITLIGIPLVPAVALGWGLIMVLGVTVLSVWLGSRLPLPGERGPFASLFLGLAVLTAVDFIPGVGTPLVFFASVVASGAVVLSRFGSVAGGASMPPMAPPVAPVDPNSGRVLPPAG